MTSSSDLPNDTRFSVFLSFRGEDTRYSFTDHLYAALKRAGIYTFRDNDSIDRGQELGPEIEKAIKESRAFVVVLSKNYAKSRWCLDELLLILEQRRNYNHFVLPVFYHVDPSDVRNHRESFALNVEDGVPGSKWTDSNVNRWKTALAQVANLTGMVVSGSEIEFISKIVDIIDCKLDLKLVSTPAHLTGIQTRAESIISWLKNEQSDNVLAICGMGGIGKTTLSQYIYNSNKKLFENSSSLEEIGKHCQEPNGLLELQKQLLKDINLDRWNQRISNISEGTSNIEEALRIKRVFIVLDDIDEHEQLSRLLGTKKFHAQSKIIITTRLLNINAWSGSIYQRCEVYNLKLMNDHESLELLSFHAFGSKIPPEDFKKLAVQVAQYCAGNPLALKVLGSSLFVNSEDPQKRSSTIKVWKSTLNSLNLLKGDLDYKIQCILRRSYDSLPRDSHKELFLHISFFFLGEYQDYVETILERDWHAKTGITTLINRCLVTVSPSNKLMMHQLLQEMGRKIVREESKDPEKRTSVCHDDESYRVLENGNGSKTIEGLALDIRQIQQEMSSEKLALKTRSIAKIGKLKLLQLKYVKLTGSYKNFPNLSWLCWHGCHLKTIPSGLLMSSLVAINMSNGNLKKFEPPTVLNFLKILNLKGCNKLDSVRNLARLPNLETLILWECSNLTYLCKTIGGLKRLTLLDLSGCKNLWKVSSNNACINQLERLTGLWRGELPKQLSLYLPNSLEYLFINNCKFKVGRNDVPILLGGQPLLYLNLGYNRFPSLPKSLDLTLIRVLDLTFCRRIKSLLCLPDTLEELYTYQCTLLEKITFQSARFRLMKFGYEGCYRLSEVQGLFKLVPIRESDEADLGHMKWIKAYEDQEVELVGDEITVDRRQHIQMLYEYGIMSSYLQGIENEGMMSEYKSESHMLSFCVPLCPKKQRIQGLSVSSSYRSLSEDDNQDMLVLFAKISNTTKGLTWIYNPMVHGKAKVGEDVVWFSYWPIGNLLDTGDEVNVSIIVGNGLMVTKCGASLVYVDFELEEEKHLEKNTESEEVIGGNLSEFELTTGVYYLCRRDFFKSATPDLLKMLVNDTVHYPELQGWRKTRGIQLRTSFMELQTYRDNPWIGTWAFMAMGGSD